MHFLFSCNIPGWVSTLARIGWKHFPPGPTLHHAQPFTVDERPHVRSQENEEEEEKRSVL